MKSNASILILAYRSSMLALLIALSGCVSSALDSNQFRPVGGKNQISAAQSNAVASNEPVSLGESANTIATGSASGEGNLDENGFDAAGKQAAIVEMRAKGQQTSGTKTHIGALPTPAASQMTEAEKAEKAAELSRRVAEANAEVSESEVESKQASIKRLQQKAKTHYKQALQSIEN